MSDPYDPQLTLQENAAKQQKLREEAEEITTLHAQLEAAKAALRRLVDDIHDYERVNNLAPNPPRTECWDSVADALAVLEGKPAP
jgi:hypothetical protein